MTFLTKSSTLLLLFVTLSVAPAQECPAFSTCECEGDNCFDVTFVGKAFTNITKCEAYCLDECDGTVASYVCGIPDNYEGLTCDKGGDCSCGEPSTCQGIPCACIDLGIFDTIYSDDECLFSCVQRCGEEINPTFACGTNGANTKPDGVSSSATGHVAALLSALKLSSVAAFFVVL
jgi:hypothetical protein